MSHYTYTSEIKYEKNKFILSLFSLFSPSSINLSPVKYMQYRIRVFLILLKKKINLMKKVDDVVDLNINVAF